MMSVVAKARDGKYNYPARPVRPAKPVMPRDMTDIDEVSEYSRIVQVYEKELRNFNERLSNYNAECEKIETRFRNELEIEFKTTDHPKAERIFQMAWARGHYAGKEEVALTYRDLMDLLND